MSEQVKYQVKGDLVGIEYVRTDDEDGRDPGTYITILIDEDCPIHAGRVVIEYETEGGE